jgi:hypothetical protein
VTRDAAPNADPEAGLWVRTRREFYHSFERSFNTAPGTGRSKYKMTNIGRVILNMLVMSVTAKIPI